MAPEPYNFEYFNVTFPSEYVAHVEINRKEKLNAFHEPYVRFRLCFIIRPLFSLTNFFLSDYLYVYCCGFCVQSFDRDSV
jgi:hypothetical protein